MDAASIVLMERENGILTKELGSYGVEEGIGCIYKAFAEDKKVNLYLTVNRDVSDEEFSDIFERYNLEAFETEGYEITEIDDEYNPVWCIKFDFVEDNDDMREMINNVIGIHLDNLQEINFI